MSFLNPILLWGPLALAGIALPVIIHLLSRFRPKPMEWAAMELLRRALVVRARRVRLEDILLLILRATALAAVAFALARPSINASTSQWVGNSKVAVVIAVDGSFSMAHQAGVTKSRFEYALQRAREIVATLSANDPVTLVLMGQRPRILLRNVAYDPERTEEAIKSMEPLPESLNVEVCLDEIGRLLADMKAPAKECYVITDVQASTWSTLSEAVANAVARVKDAGTVFFVPVGPQNAENVALTGLEMASGVLRKGAVARFDAEVRNFGRFEARNLSAKLLIDDSEADKTVLETIPPGETRTLSFFAPFQNAGTFAVTAVLDGNDPLATDNRRYLVAEVQSTVKVLCVDGSPSTDRLGGEAGILSLALSAQGRTPANAASIPSAASGVAVSVLAAEDVRATDFSAYDIVCLAGVGELSQSQTIALSDFVSRGGGLIVFLGNKSERNEMNAMRGSDGTPLLPAELSEVVGEQSSGGIGASDLKSWHLSAEVADHPVTEVLTRLPREQWAGIRFWRYVKSLPRDDARVLLRLDPSNDPILIERKFGRGKVYLFTCSANRDGTDLVVNPIYLMMVQQMLTDLMRKPYESPVTVGDQLPFGVTASDTSSMATVRGPGGDDIFVRVVGNGELRAAIIENAQEPGVYSARATGALAPPAAADRLPEQRIAVNVDNHESAVSVMRDADLNAIVSQLSLRLIDEKQGIRSAVTESRQGRELWRILLIAALVLLMMESILAGRFTRRMQGPAVGYSTRLATR